MRDREFEIEADTRDKHREMEEIDEILKKRMGESGTNTDKENEVSVLLSYRCYTYAVVRTLREGQHLRLLLNLLFYHFIYRSEST